MEMMAQWMNYWSRLWAMLLIATIGFQALEPVEAGQPSHTGSAFSASTLDVAVASVWRADVQAPTMASLPPLIPVAPVAYVMDFAVRGEPMFNGFPQARGPPPRERSERSPDPRAPPFV